MLKERSYNRTAATQYAIKWALSNNPAYYNFDSFGGDCTNFASQCIYAGSHIMNYTPDIGWYYKNIKQRSPSWSGVQFLYYFLINNKSEGPYAVIVDEKEVELGDIVQLGDASGKFYHSLVVVSTDDEILVATHTFNALFKPLSEYTYSQARFIHIIGVRSYR